MKTQLWSKNSKIESEAKASGMTIIVLIGTPRHNNDSRNQGDADS